MPNQAKTIEPRQTYYRSLRRWIILIVLLVSFTPVVFGSGIILKQYADAYRDKVYAHLAELVQKHKQNIDAFLSEKLNDIRFLGFSHTFNELKEDLFLEQKLKALQREFGLVFEDLGVITRDGVQVAYAGPFKLVSARYAAAEWFQKALQSPYYISDVFLGLRGLPHFIVVVRQKHNGIPWLLRATIDFMAFNTLVENLRIDKTGFAFIVNRRGAFQTKPRFDAIPDKGAFRYFFNNGSQLKGKPHIVERKDPDGIRHIYVAAALKGGDWIMIYQQRTEDAFALLKRTQTIALAVLGMGGVSIVVIAYFLSRILVDRIATADREKEMLNRQMIETGKLASIGELAAGIAHEINNPVAIMYEEAGWIQDLLAEEEFQEGENLAEFKRSLHQIKTQGRRCKEITHKLLSFARKTEASAQDIRIEELIQEVISLSAQRAKFSNVSIQTDFEPVLPMIRASYSEMQQVFLNLINNAMDAMDAKGGDLTVTARRTADDIEIRVADTGPGIPESSLDRIFDPFFTTKPVGKGTGLGLSICYGIIHKMGGDLTVNSVVDQGTDFCVRIPLNIASADKDPEDGPQNDYPSRTR